MTDRTLAITIRNLTKVYRRYEKPAIDKVDLNIREGDIFGLLGPNGAGKTTMIRILCGLLSPTAGEIEICGFSLRHNLSDIRRIIGVVPQEIALYHSLTARENLSVYGGICGLKGSALKQRIEELLKTFGLDKSRGMQVGRFSGGMKRRLNLIAGLLHSPRVLFLDEPTVGVDVQSKNAIIENLVEINRGGTTIVYTSHYLEEAENLCSTLAILDEGHIITRGSLNEIRMENNSQARLEDIFLELTGKNVRD
jgi:ABC-2 type transport system ATP-binding protein